MIDEKLLRIRPAERQDAEQLAKIHFICSSVQPGSFMHSLGQRFFIKYYQIILGEKSTVVLCADAGRDGPVGLISATLDSKKQLEAIHKERFKLLLSVIPVLFRKPRLIRQLSIRARLFSSARLGGSFIVNRGPRIAYWAWLPGYPSKGKSIRLVKELIFVLENLGARELQLEVDRINRKVEITHRFLGAKVIKIFTTRDGRERVVMKYILNPKGISARKNIKNEESTRVGRA